ncbi:MAG: molybdopterin-dependent oxidoreductase, partial [Coriobacteriales bacterium]|nr:molybdopterin-dependent oxidoreductase [Coriobacteriales bacterium]
VKARPIWDRYAEICAKYTLEETEKITGVPAKLIEEACLTWVNPLDPTTGYGNGGLHYQLAPDQCGNAIQSERAMAILSAITNNTDVPGGNRGQTRMLGVNGSPGGAPDDKSTIQFPRGTISFMGNASMVDAEIFPLNRWFNFWSDCECTWDAALTGKPYYIKGGICCAADFMSMSNSKHAHDALAALEFFVALELWHTPTTELADIILPAAHWLELDSPRMSQGASGAIGATVKCIEPPGEARSDVAISLGMFKAFGLPWSANPEKPFFELEDELNASVAGMRMTWREYAEAFQSHGWWDCREISYIWHNYRRWEAGCLRQIFSFGTIPPDGNVGFYTPTGLTEIWSTVMESHGNTPHLCLPDFHEPPRSPISSPDDYNEYPLLMTTGSRQPVYFHSEHRQLPWCREQWPVPRVEMHPDDAKELGLEQGDWVWIENANGRVREVVDFYYGIAKGTVNANHQWWFPENVGPDLGYDLCNINIINYKDDKDPVCGAATLRAFPCKIYKATPENSPYNDPIPRDPVTGERIIYSADDPRLKEWLPTYEGRE